MMNTLSVTEQVLATVMHATRRDVREEWGWAACARPARVFYSPKSTQYFNLHSLEREQLISPRYIAPSQQT